MIAMNAQWRLVSRPEGRAQLSDFEWREVSFPQLQQGEVRIRVLQLSLDPASRGWMRETASYLPPVAIGAVMRGIGIGVVEASKADTLPIGTLVQGMLGWQTHCTTSADQLTPLPTLPGIPVEAYMAVLGHIGMTAYFGLLDIGRPEADETLVVSAAAGAVGSLVGQIGKIKGCRVIGITGTDEKCQWIQSDLGFDGAINYKTEDVSVALKRSCPSGIDIYFENVGGKILDAVLLHVNKHARMPICGLISMYNTTKPVSGPYNFSQILTQRVRAQGFIVLDYMDRAAECMMQLAQWIGEGRLKFRVDVVPELRQAPEALNMLFDGTNKGKLIVKVSDL